MNKELDLIAHSSGCRHARELKRSHVRIVESANRTIALNMLYPYPKAGAGGRPLHRFSAQSHVRVLHDMGRVQRHMIRTRSHNDRGEGT